MRVQGLESSSGEGSGFGVEPKASSHSANESKLLLHPIVMYYHVGINAGVGAKHTLHNLTSDTPYPDLKVLQISSVCALH